MSGSTSSGGGAFDHAKGTGPVPVSVPAGSAQAGADATSAGVTTPLPVSQASPEGLVRLGRYRVLQRLGEGGMGVVHLGVDDSGRAVAIKMLRDHVAGDAEARTRLAREVSSLSRVHHRGVAPVLDADVDGSRPYLVTKYVPGPPLDEWVRRHGPLEGAGLVAFAFGLSDALAAIHAAGVIHRDVKPGNVLMLDGVPVLIDFGIAHLADEARLTVSGLIMGTPGYLSPELLAGRPVSEATDWWGWAATLAYAATGRAPFGGGGMDAIMHRTLAGECDLRGVDPRLTPLLRAALDPVAERRPHRPAVMAALAAYAAGDDTTCCLGVAPDPALTRTSAHRLPPTAPVPTAATPSPPVPQAQYAGFDAAMRPLPTPAEPKPVRRVSGPGGSSRYGVFGTPPPVVAEPAAGYPAFTARPAPAGTAPAGTAPAGTAPAGPAPAGPPVPLVPPESGAGAPVDPRIGRRARTGTLAALALAVAALATVLPVAAVLVGLAWSTLARTADRSVTALTMRRSEHGVRGRDIPLAVLSGPVHLVAGVAGALLTAPIPLALGIAAGFGTAVVSGAGRGIAPDPTDPLPLAAGMLAAILTAWWGFGGTSLRRGSRSLARGLAPGSVGAVVVGGLLLAAAAYLAVRSQATGVTADWWPLRNGPIDGLWRIP